LWVQLKRRLCYCLKC